MAEFINIDRSPSTSQSEVPNQNQNKTLSQSKLAFTQIVEYETNLNNSTVRTLVTDAINASSTHPKWVQDLLQFFEFQTVQKEGKTTKYTMKCLTCEVNKSKTVLITDKGSTSFLRHIRVSHVELLQKVKNQKNQKAVSVNALPSKNFTCLRNVTPYDRNDPRQKRFEKDLLNFVIMDTAPFQTTEGAGFQSLIKGFDEKIIFPHPRSIQRWLENDYEKIKAKVRKELNELNAGALHFIVDIWTSQQGKSIIGFKVQFIKNWQMKSLVIGFRHFPSAHTSENVRSMLEQFLGGELKLLPSQIGSITADNAANILGVFKEKNHATTSRKADNQLVTQSMIDEITNYVALGRTDEDYEESLMIAREQSDVVVDDSHTEILVDALDSWTNASLKRNGCLTHIIHLAVKDSVKKSTYVAALAKKITDTVSFFHNSPKWTAVLRKKTNGLSLVKPVSTRWNSLYNSIKRLIRKDQINVAEAVNATICEAKSVLPKKSKLPALFTEDELEFLKVLMQLLKPCSDLTDKLQSDGVTSSIVILGFIDAIKSVESVEYDVDLEHLDEIREYQAILLKTLLERFADDTSSLTNRGRRIVKVNVFRQEEYIIATMLDNRIKAACFIDSLVRGTVLEGKIPTADFATKTLKDIYDKYYGLYKSGMFALATTENQPNEPEVPKKKSKTMFSLVSEVIRDANQSSSKNSELDDYLQLELDTCENAEKLSPLQFWLKNENKFPILSKIALMYLGMPASSGSVERLFSVANSLGKARNARLLPETVEMLLCCKSFRVNLAI